MDLLSLPWWLLPVVLFTVPVLVALGVKTRRGGVEMTEQEVLDGHVLVLEPLRLVLGRVHELDEPLGEAGFQFTLPLLDHHVFAARKDNHLSGGDGELTIRECCCSRLRLGGGT